MSMKASAPEQDTEDQDRLMGVSRDMWDDYITRFRPVENELIDSIGNTGLRDAEMGRAKDEVDQSFDAVNQQTQMRAGRTGGMNAEQLQANDARMGLSKAVANTTTSNNVRQDIRDRDTQTLGTMVNVGRGVRGTALNGLNQAASRESNRNNTNSGIAASNTAGRWGLAGTVAGAGLMMMA